MQHKILLVFVYLITIFFGLHLNKQVTQMIQIKNYGISLDGNK